MFSKNDQSKEEKRRHRRRWITVNAWLMLRKGERYLPPIVRSILGLAVVGLGVLGFLPILGFWMVPLGLALIAIDIPPMCRWMQRKLQASRRKALAQAPNNANGSP